MTNESVIKQEEVGYLKSALNLRQGTLALSKNRLYLEIDDSGIIARGVLIFLPFLKTQLGTTKRIFDFNGGDIRSIVRGKHGAQRNVLEITDSNGLNYRIIVNNFKEWEDLIKQLG